MQACSLTLRILRRGGRGGAAWGARLEVVPEPFDLARGPLVSGGVLVRLGDEDHVFLSPCTISFRTAGRWGCWRELGSLYGAFSRGLPDPLPPLAIQYPDYAAWQRQWLTGERLDRQADYWRRHAGGCAGAAEPADGPAAAGAASLSPAPSCAVQLDAALTEGLKQLSRRHGMTLFMTVLAAGRRCCGGLSGQDDLVIGTPAANRGRPEIEGLIGLFVNTLALRIDLAGAPRWPSFWSG